MNMTRRDVLRAIGAIAAMASAGSGNSAQQHSSMLTKPIPSTGEDLPVIGLGTWQTFDAGGSAAKQAPLEEVLRQFAAMGGRVIDSSPMYGSSEEVVGDLAARTGLDATLFIATKVWTSGRARGIQQMEASMRKLRRSRLDLIEVHNLVDVETQLGTLREWKKAGRVRYIGITHYTSSAYAEVESVMRREPVDFVQINYSALERQAEARILPLAREKGIAVIANRPFAEGSLLRRLSSSALPSWAGEIGCTSWAQLLLKFVVSHPAITCVIPATAKVEHLRDNMGAGSGRMPDAALRAKIAKAIG